MEEGSAVPATLEQGTSFPANSSGKTSSAISQPNTEPSFTLPGAETFARYLRDTLEGKLTVEGPQEVINGRHEQVWSIYLNDVLLGKYTVHYDWLQDAGQQPAPENQPRNYRGRLPGYANPLTKKDEVGIGYSRNPYRDRTLRRSDFHEKIPFP